ncbi:MAG: alpha/beta hydrolase-fold protein [bacterium]
MSVSIINDFLIPQLNTKRRIWIYLPPDYKSSGKSYPVLYMHDGQNLFYSETSFAGSWNIANTLDCLYDEKKHEGIIVVGVDNAGKNRMREYNPWLELAGKGSLYSDFIVNTLKPYVDANYRTKKGKDFTGVMGSSMGAYISAYIALKNPDIFSRVGLLSPAFWLYKNNLDSFLNNTIIDSSMKIYFSVGTKEGDEQRAKDYLDTTQYVHDLLSKKISKKENFFIELVEGGTHSECEWAKIFPKAVTWLF